MRDEGACESGSESECHRECCGVLDEVAFSCRADARRLKMDDPGAVLLPGRMARHVVEPETVIALIRTAWMLKIHKADTMLTVFGMPNLAGGTLASLCLFIG